MNPSKKPTAPDPPDGETPRAGAARPPIADVYRLLVDAVSDYAIFALDTTGHVLTWNAGAERIKGYRADEIIGKHFSIFYPRELVAEGFPEFELRTAANTGRFEDEGWRIRADGSRFWANVVITALRDERGDLVGFGKITRDLTERREAEEALRESEQRFRLLVEGVRDYAIYMLDPTGRVTTWNAGAERIKGYRTREIIGQPFTRFYPREDVDAGKPQRDLELATRAGRVEEEAWRVRKDGTRFWALVLISAVRNHAGELVGFAKITRDLTERRKATERALEDARRVATEEAARQSAEIREHELRHLADELRTRTRELEQRTREAEEARARADDANRVKGEFLAAMSHELRTPLNAIGGFTDLLMMELPGPVTPQQQQYLERIRRGRDHLLGIINDILNFSRIEAGQLLYEVTRVSLCGVADSVGEMVAAQAATMKIELTVAESPDAIVMADRAKTEQIVLNLVSNALKFTASGGSVTLSCERLDGNRGALRVRDTGSGIREQHLESIFEPFVQIGRTLSNAREGTGLGLAISRDLARGMGGDIVVESEPGVGSTFTLVLPLPLPVQSDADASTA